MNYNHEDISKGRGPNNEDEYIQQLRSSNFGRSLNSNSSNNNPISEETTINIDQINSNNKLKDDTQAMEANFLSNKSDDDYDSDDSDDDDDNCEGETTGYRLMAINPVTGEEKIIEQVDDKDKYEGRQLRYDPKLNKLIEITDSNLEGNLHIKQPGRDKLVEVMGDIRKNAICYGRWARFYKILNVAMITTALGVKAAAIYFNIDNHQTATTILMIIAIVIVGLYAVLKVGTRGVNYRQYCYMLNILYSNAEEALRTFTQDNDFNDYADLLRREIYRISFEVFKMSYGPNDINGQLNEDNNGISIISSKSNVSNSNTSSINKVSASEYLNRRRERIIIDEKSE